MHNASSQITQPARLGRPRLPRVLRSASPAATIAVAVSLLIGGAGFADAATGGSFRASQ